MPRSFPLRLAFGATVIALAVACGEHTSPTSPIQAELVKPPKPKGHTVAACNIPYDMNFSARIGPLGGKLDLGEGNSLKVPAGALLAPTTIYAHVPKGNQAKVQFAPEGLRFLVPSVLTASYSACVTPTYGVTLAYLRADTVVEVVPSAADPVKKVVKGYISHFSSYAVAY